jgi:HTH-type transcriptional regulator/antitoxin HigA
MDIRPIRTDRDHKAAVRLIEEFWGSKPGTKKGDMLDILATLVDAYESKHFALDRLDPIETIKAHMDIAGHSQGDFGALLGSRSHASEILGRRRRLNIRQVHKIAEAWKIPAELLIQPYELERAVA